MTTRYQVLSTEDETYVKVDSYRVMEISDFLYDGGQTYRMDELELTNDGTFTIAEIHRIYDSV